MTRRLLNVVPALLLCVAVAALWMSSTEWAQVPRDGGAGVAGGSDVPTYALVMREWT